MRNRQTIQYLIYPRFFNAHSILYKGTYMISFKLYNSTKNNTITYAYPFPVSNPSIARHSDSKGEPTIHTDGNFTYCTHKFQIIYEEQRKVIESQCIFRLQFEFVKNYNIFLDVRLLRKVSNSKSLEENGLCVRKIFDTKYQIINQQVLELKRQTFLTYERIKFRSSQFFSSVDVFLCNFNYGYKIYKSKMQISHFFNNVDLHNQIPLTLMKEKCESMQYKLKKEEQLLYHSQLMRDFQCGLPSFYTELLSMIMQYHQSKRYYQDLYDEIESYVDRADLPPSKLVDLDYVKMKNPIPALQSLKIHYEVSTPQEILCFILEEKELVCKNIRSLRQYFCKLIAQQREKDFIGFINKSVNEKKQGEQKLFVYYVSDLSHLEDIAQDQLRTEKIQKYIQNQSIWNKKINNIPLFFIENYEQGDINPNSIHKKITSLTVFVHGYQGNSFDFQKAKNYLKQNNKNTHVLIIESITNEMNQSIEYLGKQAADEVTRFIENTIVNFSQINFIGFSLGGIIARSAFTYLQKYWSKFNMFITFSSPHLGISQSDNNLVNIGIWYLIKIDKVKNLKELNFQSVKFSQSTLVKLSKCEGLSQFKKVVLVCSKTDGFVPFYSTVLDSKRCERKQIKQLCQTIINRMKHVQRVEMFFDIQNSGTLDKLTGRKGHIQFLDNDYFLDIFFRLYAPFL